MQLFCISYRNVDCFVVAVLGSLVYALFACQKLVWRDRQECCTNQVEVSGTLHGSPLYLHCYLNRRLGGPHCWSVYCGEEKHFVRFRKPDHDASVVQPIISHYTDCSTWNK